MTEKIAIVVDSGSDVPQTVLKANENVAVVPLNVTMDGQDYQDGVNLTPAAFYARLSQGGELPRTASPAPYTAEQAMQGLFDQGYTHIIGITIASGLSATHQTFKVAAAQFSADKVTIIDTKNIGIGSGLQAVYALQLIREGLSYADVIARIEASVPKSRVYFYVPTLSYLQAGGRIGRVAGIVGSALKIRPVISCGPDGIYYVVSKSRSEAKAMKKITGLIADDFASGADGKIAVAHGANPDLMNQISADLETATGHPIDYKGDISPSLGVHTGPGLIGVAIQIP